MNKKKLVYWVLFAVIILSFGLQYVEDGVHHLGLFELIGFIGGWILIIVGKLILGPLLQRDENYYGDLTEEGGDQHA